jgi:hypothetical protein
MNTFSSPPESTHVRTQRRAARVIKLFERIAGQERDPRVLARLVTGGRLGLLPTDCPDEARFEADGGYIRRVSLRPDAFTHEKLAYVIAVVACDLAFPDYGVNDAVELLVWRHVQAHTGRGQAVAA